LFNSEQVFLDPTTSAFRVMFLFNTKIIPPSISSVGHDHMVFQANIWFPCTLFQSIHKILYYSTPRSITNPKACIKVYIIDFRMRA
jgi:hypothetical protein